MTEREALLAEERRSLKRTGWILALVFLLLSAAFTVFMAGVFRTAQARKESYRFVGFSRAGAGDFAYTSGADALNDLSLSLEACNARVYYQGLNKAERQVYRAFEVALENGWEEVYLDSALTEACYYSPAEILVLLALDSPFLEQNIRFTEGHHFTRYVPGNEISPFGMMAEGVRITVDNFAPERLAKKKEALAAAREIAASLSGETEGEKALAVFNYLLDNTVYLGERAFDDSDYLYDALCRGESNCDGFTNSFMLLARLMGLEAFEKDYQPADGVIGHTWNCVKIDGVWYNADVTFAQGYLGEEEKVEGAVTNERILALYATFGFPDARQKQPHDFESLTPPCTEELTPPDLVLESGSELPCGELIGRVLEASDRAWVLVVTNFNLNDDALKQAANLAGSFTCTTFVPDEGTWYYLLHLK